MVIHRLFEQSPMSNQLATTTVNVDELRADVVEALNTCEAGMEKLRASVAAKVRAGKKFAQAKEELPHGAFMDWVVITTPDIDHKTATRWIKLAVFVETHRERLDDETTVRGAYILAGILPEPQSSTGGGSAPQTAAWLTSLVRSATHISARLAQRPIAEWPRTELCLLRERLKPLVEIFQQLPQT
jgi:hypothetical protein